LLQVSTKNNLLENIQQIISLFLSEIDLPDRFIHQIFSALTIVQYGTVFFFVKDLAELLNPLLDGAKVSETTIYRLMNKKSELSSSSSKPMHAVSTLTTMRGILNRLGISFARSENRADRKPPPGIPGLGFAFNPGSQPLDAPSRMKLLGDIDEAFGLPRRALADLAAESSASQPDSRGKELNIVIWLLFGFYFYLFLSCPQRKGGRRTRVRVEGILPSTSQPGTALSSVDLIRPLPSRRAIHTTLLARRCGRTSTDVPAGFLYVESLPGGSDGGGGEGGGGGGSRR
jgi:hypothetical protein